jgi:hypothetical protein
MPADVSFQDISARKVALETKATSRLPLGIGLIVAAGASAGLWFAAVAGVRTLFF